MTNRTTVLLLTNRTTVLLLTHIPYRATNVTTHTAYYSEEGSGGRRGPSVLLLSCQLGGDESGLGAAAHAQCTCPAANVHEPLSCQEYLDLKRCWPGPGLLGTH
jgi:hypothetical protein